MSGLLPSAADKLSASLGWPLFHLHLPQTLHNGAPNGGGGGGGGGVGGAGGAGGGAGGVGGAATASEARTPYTCGSLTEAYQAPLLVKDESSSKRKAFSTDLLRPVVIRAQLLHRINQIAWHQQLAKLRPLSPSSSDSLDVSTGAPLPPPPPVLPVAASASTPTPIDGDGLSADLLQHTFPLLRTGSAVATTAQIDAFFSRLASTVVDDPLSALAPLLQHGFPKDQKLVETLVSRAVPLSRAVWLLRVLQLQLSQTTRTPGALTDHVVRALLARLAMPPAAVDGDWVARTAYLVRLVEWLRAERLVDDKALLTTFLAEFDVPSLPPRKAAALCHVLQPLLARVSRLPGSDAQLVFVDRLLAQATHVPLTGALARAMRSLLRTALVAHPSLAAAAVMDPARRVQLHQVIALPVLARTPAGASGAPPATLPALASTALLRTHQSTTAATTSLLALKQPAAAASMAADELARALHATDSVLLSWSALAAHTVDRVPQWLDAFAGAQRLRKQLLPLGLAVHLGERRVHAVLRRVLEWAVTPARGGRDRPYVAALAAELTLDAAGIACTKASAPAWAQQIVVRFVDDCASLGASFADFDVLVRLLGELVRRRVLSYDQYKIALTGRGLAPQLHSPTLEAAYAATRPVADARAGVALAASGSLIDATRRAADAAFAAAPASAAVLLARHAFIVRHVPILERGAADEQLVRANRISRMHLLRTREALEDALAHALSGARAYFEAPLNVNVAAPAPAALLAGLPLHEQTCLAKEVSAMCVAAWPTLTPPRLLWALAVIEQVGCLWTLVEAIYALLTLCVRDTKSSSVCETTLIDQLRRHEAAFVWCDRAADLRSALSRQQRHRALVDAFQHRYSGALPAIEQSLLAGKQAGGRKGNREGAAAALFALQVPELPRVSPACLASVSGAPPPTPTPAVALNELTRALDAALLPPPALATEWAIAVGRSDPHAPVLRSGAFARLIALAPADTAQRVQSVGDEATDGVVLNGHLTALIDAAVLAPPLLAATDWRASLSRNVVACVLRATPWNVAANASVLRACCDAAANDGAFVDSLAAPLPPLTGAVTANVARVFRCAARAALGACVLLSDAAVRHGGLSGDALTSSWASARLLLLHTGGSALLGAALREVLLVLNDDALIHRQPHRLPLDLAAFVGEQHGVAASAALHDAVVQGVLRLLAPTLRELRPSSAPQSLLTHTCQQLVYQLRKWHQLTSGYVDVLAASDEEISALHGAVTLRLELAANAVTSLRAAHATCLRDCVCGLHALFDALIDVATNQIARVGAADDDTLMLLCCGVLRCLTEAPIALPPPRDARLVAVLQPVPAVPAFVETDEGVLRGSEERRRALPPWQLIEGLTPLHSALGGEAPVLHARAPPRYAVVAAAADAAPTFKRSTSATDDALFKRARSSFQ